MGMALYSIALASDFYTGQVMWTADLPPVSGWQEHFSGNAWLIYRS